MRLAIYTDLKWGHSQYTAKHIRAAAKRRTIDKLRGYWDEGMFCSHMEFRICHCSII